MTKIAILSDIHGNIKKYNVVDPETDIVIIPGDLFSNDRIPDQEKEVPEFKDKLDEMFPEAQNIIVVPGNHDYLLEKIQNSWNPDTELRKLFTHKYILLVDSSIDFYNLLDGEKVRIYGNPRTSLSMAFPHLWGENDIKRIPGDVDILVTHEAPRCYDLDCIKSSVGMYGYNEPGNYSLYERVKKTRPRYHIFGHIHKRCVKETPETTFINASQMNRNDFDPEIIYISWEGTKSL